MWEINLSPGFRAEDSRFAAFREMGSRCPRRGRWSCSRCAPAPPTTPASGSARSQMPTLVIHGTADRLLGVANGRQIASLIPAPASRLLEGVGHMFWWEQPQRSAELVREHALAAGLSARRVSLLPTSAQLGRACP